MIEELEDITEIVIEEPEEEEIEVEDNPIGERGYSAYEVYRNEGGTLSVDEWLLSLKGEKGATGEDGYSPSVTASKVGKETTITITNKDGVTTTKIEDGYTPQKGIDYRDGIDGKTPEKGIDYYTYQDKQDLINEIEQSNYFVRDVNYVHTDNNFTSLEKQKLGTLVNYNDTYLRNLINTKANISDIPDVSNFITKTVNNLTNYYDKTTVDEMISAISSLEIEIVTSLSQMTKSNVIYLMSASETKENNIYNEYLVINGTPELIGSTQVDLSNYYTKNESNSRYIQDSNYIHTDNNYTTDEKNKLSGLSNYDDTGIRELINGKADTSDIPTKTSDLTNDSGYLTEHQTLKTINNETLIGSGNITIKGDGGIYVGDDEPTDDSKIWIDTDGSGEELNEFATKEYVNELIGNITTELEGI